MTIPTEDQQAKWAREAPDKALKNIERVESELTAIRESLSKNETLSLGRTKLLTNLLNGLREVDGAW